MCGWASGDRLEAGTFKLEVRRHRQAHGVTPAAPKAFAEAAGPPPLLRRRLRPARFLVSRMSMMSIELCIDQGAHRSIATKLAVAKSLSLAPSPILRFQCVPVAELLHCHRDRDRVWRIEGRGDDHCQVGQAA